MTYLTARSIQFVENTVTDPHAVCSHREKRTEEKTAAQGKSRFTGRLAKGRHMSFCGSVEDKSSRSGLDYNNSDMNAKMCLFPTPSHSKTELMNAAALFEKSLWTQSYENDDSIPSGLMT